MNLALVIRRRDIYPETFRQSVTGLVSELSAAGTDFGTIFTNGEDVTPVVKDRGFTHILRLDGLVFDREILQKAEEVWNSKT